MTNKYCLCLSTYVSAFGFVGFILFLFNLCIFPVHFLVSGKKTSIKTKRNMFSASGLHLRYYKPGLKGAALGRQPPSLFPFFFQQAGSTAERGTCHRPLPSYQDMRPALNISCPFLRGGDRTSRFLLPKHLSRAWHSFLRSFGIGLFNQSWMIPRSKLHLGHLHVHIQDPNL